MALVVVRPGTPHLSSIPPARPAVATVAAPAVVCVPRVSLFLLLLLLLLLVFCLCCCCHATLATASSSSSRQHAKLSAPTALWEGGWGAFHKLQLGQGAASPWPVHRLSCHVHFNFHMLWHVCNATLKLPTQPTCCYCSCHCSAPFFSTTTN